MSTTTKFKHREIAPEVRALVTEHVDGGPGQFRVVNQESPELEDWDREYVCFGGYAGAHKPSVFAAAPELYAALDNLADLCGEVFNKPAENSELIEALRVLAKARGEG